jgi:O-antigen/teichoic acid export membrane protein
MSIARKAAWDFSSQAVGQALTLAAGIVLARDLLASGKSAYYAVLLAVLYGTNFFNFGIRSANQYHVSKDPSCAGDAHSASILFALVSTAAAFAAVWICRPFFAFLFERFDPGHVRLLWWAAPALPVSLYCMGWSGILVGLGRIRRLAAYNLGFQLVQALGVFAVWAAGGGLLQYIQVWCVLWAAGAIAMALMLPDCRPRLLIGMGFMRRTVSYGARAFMANFAGNLMASASKFAVTGYGGPEALSPYQQADSYANKFFLHHSALESGSFQPVASAGRDDAVRLVCRLTRTSLFLGVGIWVFGGLAGSLALYCSGKEFYVGIAPLWIMFLGPLLRGGSRMIAMFFSGHIGKPQIPALLDWIAAPVNIILVVYGAKHWGLMGAACGVSISLAVHFALFIAIFLRHAKSCGLGLPQLLLVGREDFVLFRKHAASVWGTVFSKSEVAEP